VVLNVPASLDLRRLVNAHHKAPRLLQQLALVEFAVLEVAVGGVFVGRHETVHDWGGEHKAQPLSDEVGGGVGDDRASGARSNLAAKRAGADWKTDECTAHAGVGKSEHRL